MKETGKISLSGSLIGQPATVPNTKKQPIPYGGVCLKKGQKTALAVKDKNLDVVKAGLSWDASPGYDLDVQCFMLGSNGKVIGDDWFVFYGCLQSPDGAVRHSGDCRDGTLPGDDEVITIQLSALDQRVQRLVFVVTIDQAKEHNLDFAGVRNAGIHLQDCVSGNDICSFILTEYYQNVISMVVGEIYKHMGKWKFNPIGDGMDTDLYGLCARYGVHICE